PSGEASSVLDGAIPSVAGKRLANGLVEVLQPGAGDLREVSWQNPAPPESFRLCSTTLSGTGPNGETSIAIPTILTAPGVSIPSMERYGTWQSKFKAVADALKQPQLSASEADQAGADLAVVLEINPRDEAGFKMGA